METSVATPSKTLAWTVHQELYASFGRGHRQAEVAIFATPLSVSHTLPGFSSRWTMPRLRANSSPRQVSFAMSMACCRGRRGSPSRCRWPAAGQAVVSFAMSMACCRRLAGLEHGSSVYLKSVRFSVSIQFAGRKCRICLPL